VHSTIVCAAPQEHLEGEGCEWFVTYLGFYFIYDFKAFKAQAGLWRGGEGKREGVNQGLI